MSAMNRDRATVACQDHIRITTAGRPEITLAAAGPARTAASTPFARHANTEEVQ